MYVEVAARSFFLRLFFYVSEAKVCLCNFSFPFMFLSTKKLVKKNLPAFNTHFFLMIPICFGPKIFFQQRLEKIAENNFYVCTVK